LRYNTPSADLHVVARDAHLRGDVDGILLQRVSIADRVDERKQDVESRVQRRMIPAQSFDDVRALLRDDDRRLEDDDDDEHGDEQRDHEGWCHGVFTSL
jgi:hypothetical protein